MASTDLRREDARLLRGEGRYVADVERTGALAASIVRSSVAFGQIASMDASAALAVPGVRAVLTPGDFPEMVYIPIRRAGRDGMEEHLQPVLALGEVRYVGEPLAVVIADDPYVAEAAADLVEVEIDPLPPSTGVDALDDASLALSHGTPLYQFVCSAGDVAAVFDAADVVVDIDAVVGRQTGLPMETRGVTAEWRDGELHLWGPAKFVRYTTQIVASLLGIAPGAVHTHRVDVGGMFGPRGELYPEDLLIPYAARMLGCPVRWIEDRREHLLTINHSRGQHHHFELAATSRGDLLGFRSRCRLDVGAYSRPIGARLGELVVETLPGPYRWTDYEIECRGVLTNKTPTGTMRGPSGLEANFVRERALDILAHRIGVDPAEVRRRNLITPDELPFRRSFGGGVHDIEYDAGDYPAVFEQVLAAAGYRGEAETEPDGSIRRGWGIGAFVEASGIGAAETVEVELVAGGRFRVGTSASEIGQGVGSMLARVVAESLGVSHEHVDVELGSTSAHDGGTGTYGSRTTIFTGSAAVHACESLLSNLRDHVAAANGVAVETIVGEGEGLSWPGGRAAWRDLPPTRAVGEHLSDGPTFGFGCVVAQLEIDAETAAVKVEDLTVGYDCGRALDQRAVEGQLRGAAVQGIGGALFEELPYDEDGQPLATTFMDYLIPTCAETPRVRTVVVEGGPVSSNPLGVRGVGEAGLVGVGAAIANAVADAAGGGALPVERLPLRPEEIARALGHGPEDTVARSTHGPVVEPRHPRTAEVEDVLAPLNAPRRGWLPRVVLAVAAAAAVALLFRRRRK